MSGFEVPPRCIDRCPATRIDLEGYDLVLKRNCTGPKTEVVSETSAHVEVLRGGVAYEKEERAVHMGETVCRNQGLVIAVNELIESTKEH
jgi:hypothetical protein